MRYPAQYAPYVPCEKVRFIPKSESATEFLPGDFILLHGKNFYARLIQFGQSLRFHGLDKVFTRYTHAALIVSPEGTLIEALAQGVIQSHLDDYKDYDYMLVRINASKEDREEIVRFAAACLGTQYGWTTILSIAFSLLTGLKFSFGFDGQEICSGLIARALERSTAIFPRDPSHITPCELASFYMVNKTETTQG